jgi:tetratricopeptide (TPR) repeat protein
VIYLSLIKTHLLGFKGFLILGSIVIPILLLFIQDDNAATEDLSQENTIKKILRPLELSELPIIQYCLYGKPPLDKKPCDSLNASEWKSIGDSFAINGEFIKAIDAYDMATELNNFYLDAWYDKGVLLNKIGKQEDAIICYEKAIEISPQYTKAWYNKGNILYRLNRFYEALDCYDHVIKNDSYYAEAWHNKGLALYGMENFSDAIDCFDKVIALDPLDQEGWNTKGFALYYLGDYALSVDCFDKVIQLDAYPYDSWNDKGVALAELGDYDKAINSFEEATDLDSRYSKAWYNAGNVLAYQGKYEEAISLYDEALYNERIKSWDDTYSNAMYNKYILLKKLQRNVEAEEPIKKVTNTEANESQKAKFFKRILLEENYE